MLPTEAFQNSVRARGLRLTGRRAQIFEFLSREGRHRSLEEIVVDLRARDPGIGRATVFRTVRLLVDMGLASSVTDARGVPRYEAIAGRPHHDHLICVECGAVLEFQDAVMERRQAVAVRRRGFVPLWHRHEIYGRCSTCAVRERPR